LAESAEGSHGRRHLHARDDGIFQTADELAGGTEQRPSDRLGVGGSRCHQRDVNQGDQVALPRATHWENAFHRRSILAEIDSAFN